jgi:hypothetical protein
MEGTGKALPASRFRQSLPRRARAAGIHLAISTVIFGVTLYLILVHWYPGFHFRVDGGWQGVRIMAAVDLVLGPLLTLVVFNPFKARRLIAFDLTCIGLSQLAALVWGFAAIHGQRPVSFNYYDGILYSMPARSLRPQPEAAARLRELSEREPPLVYLGSQRPRSERKVMAYEDAAMFEAFAPHWPEIQEHAVTRFQDPQLVSELPGFLARHGGAAGDYRFFRYQGGYGSCFFAFTAAGEPVEAIACEAD